MMQRKLLVILENKPGALARVVGLFHQRGYNIESLHVDPVKDVENYAEIENSLNLKLKEKGWNSKTPDIFNFWKRYEYCFEVENNFETYIGHSVEKDWTLQDHFNLFKGEQK